MSRDYKPSPAKPKAKSKHSGSTFFSGLLVGMFLGVAMTVGLILYVKGEHSPFASFFNNGERSEEVPIKHKITEEEVKPDGSAMTDPNKFDFYTILPDSESKISEEPIKEHPTIKHENYFVQVGAFGRADEANNLKTKLALLGFEAMVQTAEIPSKGTMHRVRIGPFNDLAKINKITRDLETNGFKVNLIKVNIESTSH